MQASPSCYAHKVLLKKKIILKSSFVTGLQHCLDDLKILGNCLDQIEANMQKI
jgi:hypothetical protein